MKPILFSSEMINAIRFGKKTQTRRVLQKQPLDILPMNIEGQWIALIQREPPRGRIFKCRYGEVGDILWVRETWQHCPTCGIINYKASTRYFACWECGNELGRWKPSIHMFYEYCRIKLQITGVRIERVQDISEEDALAEGIDKQEMLSIPSSEAAIAVFSGLWDSINKKRGFGWEINPWVWVINFKPVGLYT